MACNDLVECDDSPNLVKVMVLKRELKLVDDCFFKEVILKLDCKILMDNINMEGKGEEEEENTWSVMLCNYIIV